MNKSESIAELSKALCKFQGEVKNASSSANNPFFKSKYAPLNEILNDVRPLLSKNGLSVLQMPGGDGDRISVTTLIMHESGEWIESEPVVAKADKMTAQGAGSAITYLRRYSLSAVLGISSEEDDDGNSASGNTTKEIKPSKSPTPKKPSNPETLKWVAKITELAGVKNLTDEQLKLGTKKHTGKTDLTQLTSEEAEKLFDKIKAM